MITQRSVGRLQRLLHTLAHRGQQTIPLLSWPEYRTQLYEEGVDHHLLNHIDWEYGSKPSSFLPAIHDGTIPASVYRNTGWGQPAPNATDIAKGQQLVKTFAEVALHRGVELPEHIPDAKDATNELLASLEIDGYEFVSGHLVPATLKGTSLHAEEDYLLHLIRTIGPPNLDVVLHHHEQANETFVNGNWGAASGETRNFFIAVLRGLRDVATSIGKIKAFPHGNDKNLIEDFKTIGLLTDEEKEAILKLWVLLSYSGSHVGIQDRERARLTRLLVLGLIQWLCLKFIIWANNGFKPF